MPHVDGWNCAHKTRRAAFSGRGACARRQRRGRDGIYASSGWRFRCACCPAWAQSRPGTAPACLPLAVRLMRVLATRAEEENARLAALLRDHGHEPLLSPLTRIRLFDGPELALDSVQAILVTSANGLRAL